MSDILKAFAFNLALRRLKSVEKCKILFRDEIAPYGFDTFACGELDLRDRDRVVFFLIDWSEKWARFYATSGMVDRDPVVESLATRLEPYTWSDLRADRTFSKAGIKALELSAAEGWNEGLVVPFGQVGNRVGLVSMAGRDCNLTPEARAYLCMIAICLQTHVRVLVASEGFAVPPIGLTEREIACLRLVARGMPDSGIAEALGISRSTAHEFVEKAKRRLAVKSRAELVAVAVSLGIIDL